MTTVVDTTVEVDVPVRTAYQQWTDFESFPEFMQGVTRVERLDDRRLHWVAEIAGVTREWDAQIVEQVTDERVSWVATDGATNDGAVSFEEVGIGRTLVHLRLEFEPEGLVERLGDALDVVERRAEGDLERFKDFVESRPSTVDPVLGRDPLEPLDEQPAADPFPAVMRDEPVDRARV